MNPSYDVGTGSNKPGASRVKPSDPTYRPPSSQQTGYGSSLGGAGRSVLNDPDEESRRLAKQLQDQFDKEANEDFVGREQIKNRSYMNKNVEDDARIAREMQEQLDFELARKFAESGSPVRDPPAYRNEPAGRHPGPGGVFDDPRNRFNNDFGGDFEDEFSGYGARGRPVSRPGGGFEYGGYQPPSYGQPKPPISTTYGHQGTSYPTQNPDLDDDDEEYQRVILESMKEAKGGVKKYY